MDIPIQHISDKILKAMNRHGDSALIKENIAKLRREVPGIILRSTAMVGFPGEDEEDFVALCEFIKEAKFDRFGAFTYSKEEGTAAALLDGEVDEQTKQDRYDILMQTQLTVSEDKCQERVGETIEVLCDGFDTVADIYYGRSYADAPDIDGKIYFTAPKRIREGEFVNVNITEILDYDLFGKVC
jgi:ribosomal protein S12 methylthiotransferase